MVSAFSGGNGHMFTVGGLSTVIAARVRIQYSTFDSWHCDSWCEGTYTEVDLSGLELLEVVGSVGGG